MVGLNIAEICPVCETLGPGRRFVFWVQGCPFHCKGCIAPDWIPFKVAHAVSVGELARAIIDTPGITGITISGGEPFMQAEQVEQLLRRVNDCRPELNTIIFSGFELEQLLWKEAQRLLQRVDVLVAGVYIDSRNDGRGLRGSNNQTIHFLTEKLLPWREALEAQRTALEFHVRKDGILLAGIPRKEFQW